ncbi:MAG: ABC transporter permease, partial [Gemmataceae bacterium]
MTFFSFLMKNLLRRRVRTLLTILGVAVAFATIVSLRGVAHGFEKSFQENFEQRGADLIVTASGVPDQLRSDLDQRIGPKINALKGVERTVPGLVELVDLQRGEGTFSAMINGWELTSPLFEDLKINSGRKLQEGDRRKIMLGFTLAQHLNKKIDDTLEVQRQSFTVVGIYQSFNVFENGAAIIPLPELQDLMLRKNSVTGFSVVLAADFKKKDLMDDLRNRIESITDDDGVPYRISAQPTREYISKSLPIRLSHGMAWVTSLIALVIGAISMLNTMIMSVLERTREIGILRAIGWRVRRVILMIMGEALLLTLAAAIVGTLVAALGLRWLARVPETSGFVSGELAPMVLLEALAMVFLVALIGGSYPAFRAAGLPPSEA